jgi:hypothetical protein
MYLIERNGEIIDERLFVYPASGQETEIIQTFTAGQIINGQKLLMLINGLAYHFDPTVEANFDKVIGFAKNAVLLGESIDVLREGIVDSLPLVEGNVYYAGPDGAITDTPPSTGIALRVGIAKSDHELVINFSEPIIN